MLDMENFVSELDTFRIKLFKAVMRLLEECQRHINKIVIEIPSVLVENSELIEYIKLAARKKKYLRRIEYIKSRKKRRRKKPKHGQRRRRRTYYEPEQENSETEKVENAGTYRGSRGREN